MRRIQAKFGLVLGLVGSGLLSAGSVNAQSTAQTPSAPGYYIQDATTAAAVPAAQAAPATYVAAPADSVYTDCGCETAAPVASSCGCSTGCSTGGCQLGSRLGSRLGGSSCKSPLCNFGSQCELGDPWTLFGRGCDEPRLNVGGWFQVGGYTDNNDLFFDGQDDRLNLHQGWLFVEKVAEAGDNGEMGFGFRFDGMYGTDADDTQAFGNTTDAMGNLRGWDNGPNFTRGGGYGWALPQAYLEVAKDDWSVKVGHFYTLIGYEVVTAPDNFFYSHAMTMFNSEPFTHTGAIGTYNASDDLTIYGGWTLGWDTGFDQLNNGSSFLGGFSTTLTEDASFTYITTFGDFGWRGSDAYSHSMVLDTQLTENVNWVLQSDLVRVNSTGEDNVGLNSYMFYTCSDRLSYGTRSEWWKGDSQTGYAPHGGLNPTGSTSYYASTVGMNYKLNPNLIVRPEYRYDFSPALDYEQGTFAVDFVATF